MKLEAGLRFFARSRRTGRRVTALAAAFAVAFQALLFAWHHHELPFASRGSPVEAVAATGSQGPDLADHDCPICSAIAHHGGVPVELFAPPSPDGHAAQQLPWATVGGPRPFYLLFRSRAPPRA